MYAQEWREEKQKKRRSLIGRETLETNLVRAAGGRSLPETSQRKGGKGKLFNAFRECKKEASLNRGREASGKQ